MDDDQLLDDFSPDEAAPLEPAAGPVSGGLLDAATHPDQAAANDGQDGQPSNDVDPMLWGLSKTAPGGRQTYIWPVAGGGTSAVRGAIGPNGLRYADGDFSPDRPPPGRTTAHYGIDLPATKGDPFPPLEMVSSKAMDGRRDGATMSPFVTPTVTYLCTAILIPTRP